MPMKLMPMLTAAGFLVFSSPAAAASYYISCTNNMINVTSRSVAVLKRGFADVCQFSGPMDEASANNRASRQFGGDNAKCTCE